jgi:4a-hydroxytetrahydrobiopterin dehydratase
MMAKLEAKEIEQRLRSLPGWEYKDSAIHKLFRFKEFMEGIRFINQVAGTAESMDHHPDIHVNYVRITFVCTSHDSGGVTERDFKLAQAIEEAYTARSIN